MSQKLENFKVDFICIGAPRCATSWLYECLKEHPDVCLSQLKEPRYFMYPASKMNFSWYQKTFSHCRNGQIKGEFTTAYFSSPEALQRIKSHNPKVKIILCLRQPAKRAWSHYLYFKKIQILPSNVSFSQAIQIQPEILLASQYAKHLKTLYQLFPKDQILILIYEDLLADPVSYLQKVFSFLQIKNIVLPKHLKIKINSLETLNYKIPTWFKIINHLQIIAVKNKKFLPKTIYRCLSWVYYRFVAYKKIEHLQRLANRSPKQSRYTVNEIEKKHPMPPDVKNYLNTLFLSEIDALEKLLGRDLDIWKANENF